MLAAARSSRPLAKREKLKSRVMDADVAVLVGVVGYARKDEQREVMASGVVGQPGASRSNVLGLQPNNGFVPLNHLSEPGGLQMDMMKRQDSVHSIRPDRDVRTNSLRSPGPASGWTLLGTPNR